MKFSAPTEQLSSTGGKRSVRNILAERERDDFALSARMIAARKQLANEIHEITPENTFAKLRLIKGLSQQNVASMIGTSQSHIAKIEAGKVNIEFKTAIKIAKVLEITLDELKVLVEMSARPELHISVC